MNLSLKDCVIYLDMDGILADFRHGVAFNGFVSNPEIARQFEKSGETNVVRLEMYRSIRGTTFYANLPILKGAIKLYKAVEEAQPIILTAAPTFGASIEEYWLNPYWLGAAYNKRRWMEDKFLPSLNPPVAVRFGSHYHSAINTHVPLDDDHFICTVAGQKAQFINRKSSAHQILIDDKIENCRDWAIAGGFAILHAGYVEDTLDYLNWYREHHEVIWISIAEKLCRGGVAGFDGAPLTTF